MRLLLFLAICVSGFAATVGGVPVHYVKEGAGPKTVVFIHGWTCDSTSWTGQLPALSPKYQVIAIDLPGHGKSGSPKDGKLSMDLFARAIEAVRVEVKADNLVLAGHSMGTPVVIQYARLYPEHVRALVFVDGLVLKSEVSLQHPPKAEQYMGEKGREQRDKMIHYMFSASTTPEMQSRILKMMLDAPEQTAVSAMLSMFEPAIWKHDVLSMPILGLYADHTRAVTQAELPERFPHLEYHEIPGTGHFLMIEKPAEFNELLLDFLARTFAPATSH